MGFPIGILEWVAISFSIEIFPDQGSNLHVLHFTPEPPGKPLTVFKVGGRERDQDTVVNLLSASSCQPGPALGLGMGIADLPMSTAATLSVSISPGHPKTRMQQVETKTSTRLVLNTGKCKLHIRHKNNQLFHFSGE